MNEQMEAAQKKLLRMSRIQTALIAGILAVLLVFVIFLAVKVGDVLVMLEAVDMEQVNGAVTSLRTAADQLSQVDIASLNEGISGLSDTAGQLSALDFEKLNAFMTSLETLGERIDSLSEFFGKFLGR